MLHSIYFVSMHKKTELYQTSCPNFCGYFEIKTGVVPGYTKRLVVQVHEAGNFSIVREGCVLQQGC